MTKQQTIIFSNRAKISFSEVIFDDMSSNGCEVDVEVDEEEIDQSLELCFGCDKGGRSFLVPGIRILANLSSCRNNRQNLITKRDNAATGFSVKMM